MVTSRAALPALVKELAAAFAAFDVLAVAGQDVRGVPFAGRRQLLEELARESARPHRFNTLDLTGKIKGDAQPYLGGKRIWLKLKRIFEADIICGAVVGSIDRPTEIVAGLPIEGQLRIVGRSSVLSTADSRALARWLKPPVGTHP